MRSSQIVFSDMRQFAGPALLLLALANGVIAQSYPDSIFTVSADTVVCRITLVNENNIFYTHPIGGKRTESTYISTFSVAHYALHGQAEVMQPSSSAPARSSLREEKVLERQWNAEYTGRSLAKGLKLPRGFKLDTLSLVLEIDSTIEEELRSGLAAAAERGISRFNVLKKHYWLQLDPGATTKSIHVRVDRQWIATREQQGTAFVTSIAGLVVLPAALIYVGTPIVLFFWSRSVNRTYALVALSEDLRPGGYVPEQVQVVSDGGWFMGTDRLHQHTFNAFERQVLQVANRIHRQVR